MTESTGNRPYRGFEGDGNDGEESTPHLRGQANPNNTSEPASSMISPLFLDTMRGQGTVPRPETKFPNRDYDFGPPG